MDVGFGLVGVVGLSGQVISGCMFLKEQFDKMRDAPEQIRSLRARIDRLLQEMTDFRKLAEVGRDHEQSYASSESPEMALRHSLSIINELQHYVREEFAHFAGSSQGRFKDRLKALAKSPKIESFSVRLDRAMDSFQLTQHNFKM